MADVTLWSIVSAAFGFGAKALWDSYVGFRDDVRLESWKIRADELEKRLSQFYWPLYARLQRDEVIWQKVFYDLRSLSTRQKPGWVALLSDAEQQKLRKEIETQVLIPNHAEAAAIIKSAMHLANADPQFEELLVRYVRHVDVYTSLRSVGSNLNPIDVGEEFPTGLTQAVQERLHKYQREYEALLQDRGVLNLSLQSSSSAATPPKAAAEGDAANTHSMLGTPD